MIARPFTPCTGFIPGDGDEPHMTLSPRNPMRTEPRQDPDDDLGEGLGGVHGEGGRTNGERNHG